MDGITRVVMPGIVETDDVNPLLAKIKKLAVNKNVVQIIRTQYVSSVKQLELADYEARLALNHKRNLARDLNTEFLLRLSGQRQVKKAVNDFGIPNETRNNENHYPAIIYCSGPNAQENADKIINELNFIADETILDLTPQKKNILMKHYSVSPKALETIGSLDALICEKVSLIGLEE